jgi:photosystem II stability/assembly factor-like uncharacterized protein
LNLWTTGGPEGGVVQALAVDPANSAVVYAGTEFGGVFKSLNGGRTWKAANRGLATGAVGAFNETVDTNVAALAIDPSAPETIYAGTGDGVFKSTDGGESWTARNEGLTATEPYTGLPYRLVSAIAIDPTAPATLYAGTIRGVFKSVDGGTSWIGHALQSVSALAIDPVVPSTVYAASSLFGGGGVYKSTDGGSSWAASGAGLGLTSKYSLAIDPSSPATLYVGGGGLYKSVDRGATWIYWGFNTQINVLAFDSSTPPTLYVGTYGGIVKSGETNWIPVNTGLSNTSVRALAIDPRTAGTFFAGTENGGVFKSVDGGGNWSASSDGITNTRVGAVAVAPSDPTTVYAGTRASGFLQSGSGTFVSRTSGEAWTRTTVGMGDTLVAALAVDPTNPSIVYCGTNDDGMFKTSDGGANWSSVLFEAPIYSVAIDPSTPTTIYAGAAAAIYKTVNGGQGWFPIDNGLFFGIVADGVRSVAIDPSAPDTLYAGISGGDLYKSTDGGGSWSSVLAGKFFSAIAVDPRNSATVYAATGIINGGGEGVFRSTDGGTSWTLASDGLTRLDVRALAVDPLRAGTIYAGTWGGGVFVSRDGADSWAPLVDRLTNLQISSLSIDGGGVTLHAGTHGGGVFDFTFLPDRTISTPFHTRPPSRTLVPRS